MTIGCKQLRTGLCLLTCLAGLMPVCPVPAAARQAPPQSQPQKKSGPKSPAGNQKPAPTPAGKTAAPTPAPSPTPNQPAQPNPAQEQKPPAPSQPPSQPGKEPAPAQNPPQSTEKKPEGQTTPHPAGTPSPTPTPQTEGTILPAETPQPAPAVQSTKPEERPGQTPAAEKPAQQTTPRPVQQQMVPPPTPVQPPVSVPALESPQLSLRREMELMTQTFSIWKVLLSMLVLLLCYFANRLVRLIAARAGRRRNTRADRLRRVMPFVSLTLWLLTALLVAGIFAQSLLAVVLLITIVAVAVALASQPLLRDVIGGFVILFEHPFRIGDHISIGGNQGEVKEIGLRAFQMISPDGVITSIPNAEALRHSIVNTNPGTIERQVTAELLAPAGVPPEQAKKIVFEAAAVSPYGCIHKPIQVYVNESQSEEAGLRLVVRTYVFDARYERELKSDLIERASRGFQALDGGTKGHGKAGP